MMMRPRKPAVALAAAAALIVAGAGPASAHRDPRPDTPRTVAEDLAGPLTFDVTDGRTLYVGQAFSGALTKIRPGRSPVDVVAPTGRDVAAVSVGKHSVTWAETTLDPEGGHPVASVLKRMDRRGHVRTVDIWAHEERRNPDSDVTYGFQGLSEECAATVPDEMQSYTGHVDSHPYGSVTTRHGTYVADAGANALFRVNHHGKVRTAAVLPPAAVEVTDEMAAAFGLDPCVEGAQFLLESVPTDVEVGRHGELYVSTLPGGPEDGSLGDLGSVYRVDPRSGKITLVASGFAGATNLAVSPDGTIYVAELYGNRVSAVSRRGTVTPFLEVNQPAGLEWSHGQLYVSTDVFGSGTIVSVKVRR